MANLISLEEIVEKGSSPVEMTGAEIVLATPKNLGIEYVFHLTGGAVLPISDAWKYSNTPKPGMVPVFIEGNGVNAAKGYAEASGKIGACVVTSGPGATNTITGIADAYSDSVPVMVITGNVAKPLRGKAAFQEVNITDIVRTITKKAYYVSDIKDLERTIVDAYITAMSGRRGPVLVDIPNNIQRENALFMPLDKRKVDDIINQSYFVEECAEEKIKKLAELIKNSEEPLLYIGGGIKASKAEKEVSALAITAQIPVVSTLKALGSFNNERLSLGLVGMHGSYWANRAVKESDLLIALGVRFDDRVAGDPDAFAPDAKIVHVDLDPKEINRIKRSDLAIIGDAKKIISRTLYELGAMSSGGYERSDWLSRIRMLEKEHPWETGKLHNGFLQPQTVIEAIYELSRKHAKNGISVATGVGQHQMWAAQLWSGREKDQFITSGGQGQMGVGLSYAIGTQVSDPNRLVVDIDGDGSFRMGMQALRTVDAKNLPIKIFVMDNNAYGLPYQWQNRFFRGDAVSRFRTENFVNIAKEYGVIGEFLFGSATKEEVYAAVDRAFEYPGAYIIQAQIDTNAEVLPMIPPGKSIDEIRLNPLV